MFYDFLIEEIVNQEKAAGIYEVNFDATNLPDGKAGLSSGIYFFKTQG